MLVKIFDLEAIAKKFAGSRVVADRYTTTDTNALIEGRDKIILTEYDSVHTIHDSGPDKFIVLKAGTMPREILESGAILSADVSVHIPVDIFLKETPVREVEFREFINPHGDRKGRNYASLLESVLRIGLDPKDFSTGL